LWAGGKAQVVESLPRNHEALTSSPSTAKIQTKTQKNTFVMFF
jgi:hypothetical protein